MTLSGKEVLLVNPRPNLREPAAAEPLTLLTLAAQLEEEGFEPEILDGAVKDITDDDLVSHQVLVMTANTPQYPEAVRLLNLIKEVNPDRTLRTLIGGPHVTVYREQVLRDGWTGACIGEGDLVVGDMVRGDMSGLIKGPRVDDLDSLAFPARHLIDSSKYVREGEDKPSISLFSMRGCPYSCIFCVKSVFGRRVRFNSPRYIAEQIREVKERTGVSRVVFYDDTFSLKTRKPLEVCEELGKLDISWICNTRVDAVNEQMLRAMKESGCDMISFGLESAHDRVLEFARKQTTRAQAELAVRMAKDAGLETRVFLMFGFYEDGWDSVEENLNFLETVNPDVVRLSLLVPSRCCARSRSWKNRRCRVYSPRERCKMVPCLGIGHKS